MSESERTLVDDAAEVEAAIYDYAEAEHIDRDVPDRMRAAAARIRELEDAIGTYVAALSEYREQAQEEGIPLAEYDYARFAELALPVFEAERVLRVLAHNESEASARKYVDGLQRRVDADFAAETGGGNGEHADG